MFCLTLLLRKDIINYAVFYRSGVFSKKSKAKLFDCGAANVMSKVTHIGVDGDDTMFLFF